MSSDQQVAFDNWQQAAQELQKQEQIQKQETQQQKPQQQIPDALNQQKKDQKPIQLDPKEILKEKISKYNQMTLQQFQACSDKIAQSNQVAGKKIGNPVLKSDKDFSNYAKALAKRFDGMVQNQDATIDQQKLSYFFEELSLYMYKNLQWKNLHDIQSKLKVIKKQRKIQQDKRRKQKQKQERLKKNLGAEGSESKSQSLHTTQKKEEDLFGGVVTITSKQQEEERKNKIITESKPAQKQQEDDDDFM